MSLTVDLKEDTRKAMAMDKIKDWMRVILVLITMSKTKTTM